MRAVRSGFEDTFSAEVAVLKYRAVKGGTDESECVTATANSRNYGIARDNAPNVGEDVPVVMAGTALAVCGDDVDKDAFLKSDGDGALVEIDETPGGEPQEVTARALQDGTSREIIAVEVIRFVLTPLAEGAGS